MTAIRAAILDWAGTVIDHGSRAPMGAFVRAFAQAGVEITVADARGPMGRAKWHHIQDIISLPHVAASWQRVHGRAPASTDVDDIFAIFEPMNEASVRDHADFVPGALDAIAVLRGHGMRIGSTTGYTRPILATLLPIAAAGGYEPDIVVCAGDLPEGRPSPLMMWHALAHLGIWPAWRAVKVDDTPVGIMEGRNAGSWTVGISLTGNIAGLSAEELAGLSDAERADIRVRATDEFLAVGTDLVIDSIADLPGAIEVIDEWIAGGRRPALPA